MYSKSKKIRPWVLLALLALTPATGIGQEIKQSKVYYFGNSFLENSMPGLHPELGKSAGRQWDITASIYAGIPIWCHMNYLTVKPRMDDLNRFTAVARDTDTIVLLIYGGHGLKHVSKGYWGTDFPEPTDIGEINACATIIDLFHKHNPNGRAFVYTAWPGIPEASDFRKRVKDEVAAGAREKGLSREETLKLVKERKPTHEEMEPIRKRFDYASQWLTENYIPESATVEQRGRLSKYAAALRASAKNPKPPATLAALAAAVNLPEKTVADDLAAVRIVEKDLADPNIAARVGSYVNEWPLTHSRAHMWAVMEGLKQRYPQMWKDGKLGLIPHGDVFLALDKKMRAGQVPGIVNIGEYSTDGGHVRAGLPRYTLAATCYAVLFRDHPNHLDWKLMADRDDYVKNAAGGLNKVGGVYTHIPDLGEVLEITPERAKVVNDTIWEVVKGHLYTQVPR